jgi:hypothetical protein
VDVVAAEDEAVAAEGRLQAVGVVAVLGHPDDLVVLHDEVADVADIEGVGTGADDLVGADGQIADRRLRRARRARAAVNGGIDRSGLDAVAAVVEVVVLDEDVVSAGAHPHAADVAAHELEVVRRALRDLHLTRDRHVLHADVARGGPEVQIGEGHGLTRDRAHGDQPRTRGREGHRPVAAAGDLDDPAGGRRADHGLQLRRRRNGGGSGMSRGG